MKPGIKLVLDLLMGAVIPIAILNYLTRPLGAPVAYVFAALVPVGWVLADLLFITRRFNFITSYVGATAIMNGALAFWFVDGLLFALKDTAGLIATTLIFAVSIVAARPALRYVFIQTQNPDTPARRAALDALLREPDVQRAAVFGTAIVVALNVVMAVANFALNLNTVTASFGTEAFNQQVAQVNAITRVLFPLPSIAAFGVALWLVFRAVFRHLPTEEGVSPFESDFWELMSRREASSSKQLGGAGG